jgi:hypothetical protein
MARCRCGCGSCAPISPSSRSPSAASSRRRRSATSRSTRATCNGRASRPTAAGASVGLAQVFQFTSYATLLGARERRRGHRAAGILPASGEGGRGDPYRSGRHRRAVRDPAGAGASSASGSSRSCGPSCRRSSGCCNDRQARRIARRRPVVGRFVAALYSRVGPSGPSRRRSGRRRLFRRRHHRVGSADARWSRRHRGRHVGGPHHRRRGRRIDRVLGRAALPDRHLLAADPAGWFALQHLQSRDAI